MNIAYLILAHTNPFQLKRLIKRLYTKNTWFFIHLDSKIPLTTDFSNLCSEIPHAVYISRRSNVRWGAFSVVQAILYSLKEITEFGTVFDYVVLMSGTDYPIKDNMLIFSYFKENCGHEFIHYRKLPIVQYPEGRMDRVWYYYDYDNYYSEFGSRGSTFYEAEMRARSIKRNFIDGMQPYHGSMWWCLSLSCIKYILKLVDNDNEIMNYFRYTKFSDEQFFQTLVMNSPFADKAPSINLWYLDWSIADSPHPKTLNTEDLNALLTSGCLYARKLDNECSSKLMDTIDHDLLHLDQPEEV